ncbi:MAG: D-alanyl-D-alanine carboxypeptidase/D-alanyl-D-alanine-endopeptidase [Pseudomonadota bacterium]|nr:D-alanyl-D-alanine carboxypeptidase/D-alanyl-D-alanine-endopeptidase [Pseudomonadota bacterium]
MKPLLNRRTILSGLGAMFATGAVAGTPLAPEHSLRPVLRNGAVRASAVAGPETVLRKAGVSGESCWAVADVATGQRLESLNGNKAQPPASVAKTVTALYALETLGADYRFTTRLMIDGTMSNGVLNGDLILAGGGDPTLDTDALATLAQKLKATGLREVRGRFIVYDGALPYVRSIDEDQPEVVGYSPAVSGIALNFNRVRFEWKRAPGGYAVQMDAETERYRPEVASSVMTVVQRSAPIYTYADRDGRDHWTVASAALGKGGSRWLPVRRPGDYAGDVFRTLVRAHGIVLKPARTESRAPAGAIVVAEHSSDRLWVILQDMLKYSNNLVAEMVGMSASARREGKPPQSLRASAREMSRWAGLRFDMKNTALVDHSGLGDASRMTPDDLVAALVEVHRRGVLRPLLKPIAMRDDRGRVLKNPSVKVDAKTGTLNFVSGLGGFMTAPNGAELAFAIFSADTAARSRLSRAERVRPDGGRAWNGRAKRLQQMLIDRWGALYGS